MQWQQAIVRVWDGLPNRDGKFVGTAFFIDSRTLLTAKHVVENHNDDVYIDGVPLGGKEKIEANNIYLCDRDIAILQTNHAFPSIVPFNLYKTELDYGQIVTLNGYFDEFQSLNVIKSEISGHVSYIHTWRTQGSISRGMSGGPVVLNNENNLVGLINARDADKNLNYLIPTDVILDCLKQFGIQEKTHIAFRYNVPSLPRHYIQLTEHLNRIKELLLKSETKNVGITGISLAVGLYGMGGIGKSVLATAIAYDDQIQNAFPDGIIWIRMGQAKDITNIVNAQVDILQCFDKLVSFPETPRQGKALLNKLLVDKKILLILDDIWDIEQARAFEIFTASSKLLITTRNSKVLKSIDSEEYQINILSNEQALDLLRNQSGWTKADMPEESQQIIKECGFLPLAISMVGAMLRNRPHNRWKIVLKHLQSADLKKIRYPIRNYEHTDLFKALHVSVESLSTIIQKCYLSLAVFPEDVPIPESVLEIYWDQDDLQHYDATDIIDELLDASLVSRHREDSVTLHDLQHDYLCHQSTNINQLHEKIINAYEKSYPEGLHTIPVIYPYYFHDFFDFHLKQIEDKEKAQSISEDLLFNQPYLGWNHIVKFSKLTDKTVKQIAKQLITFNKSHSTLVKCLVLLGSKAKDKARHLLEKHRSADVITACLKILGKEAKEQARRLLQEHQNPNVITVCQKLLGEEAKEQSRRLLQEHQNPEVIKACLQLLGEEAKEDARRLLNQEHQNPDVIAFCLTILGIDASNFAFEKLSSPSWYQLASNIKAAILKIPLDKPIRKERAIEVLSEWHLYNRILVTESLMVFNDHPDKVLVYCEQIITQWESDITYYIQKGLHKYSYHIAKALRHPGLYNISQKAASEMLLKEKEHPGFLDDSLRELAQKISNGEKLSWSQDYDENTEYSF